MNKCYPLYVFLILSLVLAAGIDAAVREIVIVRTDENHPPYEMNVAGRMTGLHIDIIDEVAKKLRINVRYVTVPWSRALYMMKTGKADAISFVSKVPEREAYIIYHDGNVLSRSSIVFLIMVNRKNELRFDGNLRSLKSFNIGLQADFSYGTQFDRADYLNKISVKTQAHLLKLLLNRRIDYAAVYLNDVKSILKGKDGRKFVVLKPSFSPTASYLGFSRKRNHAKLAKEFADAMKVFKQSFKYRQILRKYHK